MAGIEKFKTALAFVINFGEAIDKRMEDGKITFTEWLTLIPKLSGIREVVMNSKDIWREYLDMDSAEKDEIVQFIETELDIRNDKAEEMIQDAFKFIAEMSVFIGSVQKFTKDDSVGGGGPGGDPDD